MNGIAMVNGVDEEYLHTVKTIGWLLGLDEKIEDVIKTLIMNVGVKTFFFNVESFNLPDDVVDKLCLLRDVIYYIDIGLSQKDQTGGVFQ